MNRNTEGVGLPHPRTPHHSRQRRRIASAAAKGLFGPDSGDTLHPGNAPLLRTTDGTESKVAAQGRHDGCQVSLWREGSEFPVSAPLTIGLYGHASEYGQTSGSLSSHLLGGTLHAIRRTADREERDWRLLHLFPRSNHPMLPAAAQQGADQHLLSALVVDPGFAAQQAAQSSLAGIPALALLHDGAGLPQRWGSVSACLLQPLELAAGHLRALGHQRIALLSGEERAEQDHDLWEAWETVRGGWGDTAARPAAPLLHDVSRLEQAWRAGTGPAGVICSDTAQARAVATAAGSAPAPVSIVLLSGRGAAMATPPLMAGNARIEAMVAVDAAPLGEAVIQWLDDLLECSCLCCAGAISCERHRTGPRLRVPLSGRLTVR